MVQSTTRPGFTLAERDRRWARVRELLAQHDVDVLLVFPRWMPGDALFLANQLGTVLFPRQGDPAFIGAWGAPGGGPDAWIKDQPASTTSGSTAVPFGQLVANRLRAFDLGRQRIAVAGLAGGPYTLVRNPEGYVNYSSLMAVREALPEATFVDGTPILTEARYVKSEEEIEVLRRSVAIAEASAEALVEHARPGAPAAEVYAHMLFEQTRRGANPAHVAWIGGPWGESKRRIVGPPPGTIETGWLMLNEIEPAVQGYTCQVDAPVCVGPVPAEAREMFDLGKAAFLRACELMRPGATWREVDEGAQAVAAGSPYKVEFLMHGRGLGDEGPMFIPTDNHRESPLWNDIVRANTVFVLKPYAYKGARAWDDPTYRFNTTWGDSVVVREGGAVRLGTRPHELISSG
jgi:Xaa-Pro aminopeptidase